MRRTIPFAAIGLLMSTPAGAASVPNTFSSGDPAVAADVNANFSALISDIEAVENSVQNATSTAFSNYSMGPSASGALGERNVTVLAVEGNNCYVARGWFTNPGDVTVETASSGTVTPDEVFVFQYVCGDTSEVTYEQEYVYAIPSSGGFDQAHGAEINEDEDGDGAFETEQAWDYRSTFVSNPLTNAQLVSSNELFFNASGELQASGNFTRVVSELGQPLTVNGETFQNVVVENFLGFERLRFKAEGIGTVLTLTGGAISDPLFNSEQSRRGAIFYRVDGQTSGDLSGTPFATSGLLINQWFQQ
ncbi:hypothetical protein [Halofilum ochraceum]|uniref:hypothetical protein n=1 Tax=Halofilum ochraceum TaxID=1611323 RepID=UPI0008D9809F|nr:hypothetical protein [Halofilum ochraceum]